MKTLLNIVCLLFTLSAQAQDSLRLNGFGQWLTGHSEQTRQIIPARGRQALVKQKGRIIAHVKFDVNGYGELSFPIDPTTPWEAEARKVDLSKSAFIRIRYKSTSPVILQLRQTGVHGGVHPKVSLPIHKKWKMRTIYFKEFNGGKKPLDLSNVAKFNFAFLSNAEQESFAEMWIKECEIDGYFIENSKER